MKKNREDYHLPKVVKLRIKGGVIVQGCDVYCGRKRGLQGGWQQIIHAASDWENPYKPGQDGTLDEVIVKYEIYIREKIRQDPQKWLTYLKNIVSQGRPLVLGCWCKADKRGNYDPNVLCHGDVIVKLCNEAIQLIVNGQL